MRRLTRRRTPAGLTACIALVTLVACSPQAPVSEEVRPVRVLIATASPMNVGAELAGEVRPRVETWVGFQVGGRITARRVELGQMVRRGDVLATLDAADFRLSAAAAAAQLSAAQVDRDQQRADFRRFEDLHRQGFISGAELERRKALLDAAEARYTQAAAQADVRGNQANYTVLRAPTAGVVSAVDAEVGQVVSAGQSVLRVAQTGEKEVVVAIPENRLEALRRIPEVRVTLWASAGELKGRVREIAPIADSATRTYTARITLVDPPPTVALGMTAAVIFEAPLPGPVITLPLQALLREGGQTYVWRLDRDTMTVRRTAVELATVSGNDLVVGTGVQPGDVVVTAGVHLLREGQKVRVLEEPAGTRSAPARTPEAAATAPRKD